MNLLNPNRRAIRQESFIENLAIQDEKKLLRTHKHNIFHESGSSESFIISSHASSSKLSKAKEEL